MSTSALTGDEMYLIGKAVRGLDRKRHDLTRGNLIRESEMTEALDLLNDTLAIFSRYNSDVEYIMSKSYNRGKEIH